MAHFIRSPSITFEHSALSAPIQLDHLPDAGPQVMDADGTFARLWPTALVLSNFLCDHPELVAGKRVVELGAGTGAVGLVCAALGAASVTLTDMPDALELLQRNADRNHQSSAADSPSPKTKVSVAPCTWGDDAHLAELLRDGGGFDVVLCCEVVYQQSSDILTALAHTQKALAAPGAKVLLAYEFRCAITEDLAYFDAATDLFGDSTSHALTGSATAFMHAHIDDGGDDRWLYIYSVPRAPSSSDT
jgi:predicted nicotinamide N-methyase